MGKREEIAEAMRTKVVAEFTANGHLTSVQKLQDDFDVSIGTAVRAMKDLIEAGYIYSNQRGYFMAASLPITEREDEQRAIAAELRAEAQRLQEIATRLDRTI
ncbi:hypothetical protein GCM10009691_41440 [Brevibacterium picturae]|uniref:Helix-turn-helix type 11 domain-containing protein n=2 Tax=Brevibacterium picturae TaxID=260553 RepID=A0ABP4NPK6_9MICO